MSVSLLPVSSKLKIYLEELIHPLVEKMCKSNYKWKLCHHSFIIVDGKQPNLCGKDMLRVIKIDCSAYIRKSQIYNINSTD